MNPSIWLELLARNENALGLGLLFLASFIEYIFPPFPGDTIVLFGAFLVARRGWPGERVFGAVMLGSGLGCMIAYGAGRLLRRREESWASGRLGRFRPQLDTVIDRFSRHGVLYIVINRFLPSLRALFFVAAGMARLPAWKVLVCGLISAAAWNALIFTVGATLGSQWSRVQALFRAYGLVAWAIIAVVATSLAFRWWWRRRKRLSAP